MLLSNEFKKNILYLMILLLSMIFFIVLDVTSIIYVEKEFIKNLLFIIATVIVTMTVYVVLRIIIIMYPMFLNKGILASSFKTILFGLFILMLILLTLVFCSNNLDFDSMVSRIITFIIAYPVSFILVLMIDGFYKSLFNIEKEKRLFISTISINIILVAMILFSF